MVPFGSITEVFNEQICIYWREEYAIFKNSYRPGDEETREEIPKGEEEGHANGGNLVAWRECNQHHPIECEIDQAHEHEI